MKATGNSAELRRRAEIFQKKAGDAPGSSTMEMNQLLHELSVHQIELELQNEELEAARAEAEIARNKYFALYDLAPVGYAGFDQNGAITDINLTGAEYLGQERSRINGRRFSVFLKDTDTEAFAHFLRRAFMTGRKESCEVETGMNVQERRILLIEGRVQETNGRDPPVCRAALIDMTARRDAERRVGQADQNLEDIIDSAAGPIVVWDKNFRIVRFNRAFGRLTGLDAKKMEGQPLARLFPEEGRVEAMTLIRTTAEGRQLDGIEIPVTGRVGKVRTVLWNSAIVPSAKDTGIVLSVGQGQDITARKQAEEELHRKIGELNATNDELVAAGKVLREQETVLTASLEEKEILLSEIHHRVKNNLAAFISLLSLDGSLDESPAGTRLKQNLQNRARSMALIHETLYRTRQYSTVNMETYLTTLVEQVAASYAAVPAVRTRVDATGVTLDITRATPCGLIVNELVTNSLKYAFPAAAMKENGRAPEVVVSVIRSGNEYELVVRDNGIGISEKFRSEKPKTLGLRLIRFLARHQLRAEVSFTYDGGTECLIRFPGTNPDTNGA